MSDGQRDVYPSTVVSAVVRRYGDAYVLARAIDGFGATIKAIGIAIGATIALGALIAGSKGGGVLIAFMGIALAGTIATVLYLLGTLASAQGQILKATLDTAVNSSQFLTAQDRAQVMSLPYAAPAPHGAVVDHPAQTVAAWRCGCGQQNPAGAHACLECGVRYGAA